jgi:hypothetical protein
MDNLSSPSISEREHNPSSTQRVTSGMESLKEATATIKRGASEEAMVTLESAKSNIKDVAQQAAGYGRGVFNEQKGRLAEIVHEYGQAAKTASEKLQQEGHSPLADRAEAMASRLELASTYLREKELSELYDDAERFTRRRPEVVFGIMFAAGLMVARFLKASDRGLPSSRSLDAEREGDLPQTLTPASTVGPETKTANPI